MLKQLYIQFIVVRFIHTCFMHSMSFVLANARAAKDEDPPIFASSLTALPI